MGLRSPLHANGSPREAGSDHLWARVFGCRHISIVALGAAAGLIPQVGPNRGWLAAVCLFVILPVDLLMHLWARRLGRLPAVTAFIDQAMAIGVVVLFPAVWTPVLLASLADLALMTVLIDRRTVAATAVAAVQGFALAAVIQGQDSALPGIVAYLICAPTVIVTIGAIAERERSVRRRYANLVDGLDAVVWEADPATRHITFVSRQIESLLGHPPEAWLGDPRFWLDQIHPSDLVPTAQAFLDAMEQGYDQTVEYRMIAADGSVLWLEDSMKVDLAPDGSVIWLRGEMVDVTARKQAQERIRQYADIFENMQVGLHVWQLDDPDDQESFRLVALNPAASELSGRAPADVVGRRVHEIFEDLCRRGLPSIGSRVVRSNSCIHVDDVRLDDAAGNARRFSVKLFPLPDRCVGLAFDDVTDRKQAEATLRHQALHDPLTGLANRTLLYERMEHGLALARRDGSRLAIFILDVDRFKDVNDTLGHSGGDQLLRDLGARLVKLLRETDTVARLGGDEFAILLPGAGDRGEMIRVASRIRAVLEQPFSIDGRKVQATISMGIALYPEHAADPETLVHRADVAMYAAKRMQTRWAFWSADDDPNSRRRLAEVSELRRAINGNELTLHYQPKIDFRSGQVVGVEALVRWNHPQHGLLAPGEFLPLAVTSGLIHPLTTWVIRRALEQCAAWRASGLDLSMAVNVSAASFSDPNFPVWVQEQLDGTNLPVDRLTLEITETELMDGRRETVELLDRLGETGVRLSVDDFGTGYSSLSHLRRMPIHEIKIDRSFVAGMADDENDATIVRSIVDLSHNLGLRTVVEGVETRETLDRLMELTSCDLAQGFHICRPLPAEEFMEWLDRCPWGIGISQRSPHAELQAQRPATIQRGPVRLGHQPVRG